MCFIMLISCKKENGIKTYSKAKINNQESYPKIIDPKSECSFDSLKMQTSEYNGVNFYSENTMRGKGILQLSINENLSIMNIDNTSFGSISFQNNSYKIKLPSKTIAREIIPDSEFQIFSFDAEFPETSKEYLIIYLNKERKLINKKNIEYKFLSWEDYIKSAYVQLTNNIENISKEEHNYWYKVLEIKNDSMQIKSVPKTDCDYIESYKDVTKRIKWKNQNCKLIKLTFCY